MRTAILCALVMALGGCKAAADYMKKSKASEPRVNLKKMADGARSYFLDEHMAPGGLTVEHSKLPPSAPLTPAGGCCQSAQAKCMPDPALWAGETWQALQFSVDEPHYYAYEFVAEKDGFIARAVGDLDCDGTTSLFEIHGQVDPASGDLHVDPVYVEHEQE